MPNQLRSNTLPPIVSNTTSNNSVTSHNFSSRFHRTTNSRESMLKVENSRTSSRMKLSPRTPPASYGTCNSSLASEFATRFFGKSGGRPTVIGLDAKRILKDGYSTSRSLTGFFPAVKLRTLGEGSGTNIKSGEKHLLKLKIKPCKDKPENHVSKPLSLSLELGPVRKESASARQTMTIKPENCVQAPLEPEKLVRELSRGDLTSLPRPRMVVKHNESPWIFRQKVKQGMNGLSRIVASRTPTNSSNFMYLHY